MCYFDNLFNHPEETIRTICNSLNNPKFGKVDMVIGTGISGALALIPVSMASGIPCLFIHKEDEKTHSPRVIEPQIPKIANQGRYSF